MKRINLAIFLGLIWTFTSCGGADNQDNNSGDEPTETNNNYAYSVTLEAVTGQYAPPALQSFVKAQHNEWWLLFAGRTNGEDTLGGLHKQVSNYAVKSFPPKSYNPFFYTYNPVTGDQSLLNYYNLLNTTAYIADSLQTSDPAKSAICVKVAQALVDYGKIFRNSNPQSVQDGDYLYVVGGYGTALDSTDIPAAYRTYDVMARINVPTLIKLVNREWDLTTAEWTDLFRFGQNPTLRATGGELHKLGDTFYLAGGHNFYGVSFTQIYLNCVYAFNFSEDASNLSLSATILDTISDVPLDSLVNNPKWVDSTSKFRRRDGPIVPSLYYDASNKLSPNFSFLAGVFTYNFGAWEDAIHITPGGNEKYHIDSQYQQFICNVYSCPDFSLYDESAGELHTFLPGGIGNGVLDTNLSGFTNTMGHAIFNPESRTGTFDTISNAFPSPFYYGAEGEFFPTDNVQFYKANGITSGVIDADATFGTEESVVLGYIYGGIESFVVTPAGYGGGKSGASDKVWKVTATRIPLTQ